MLQQQLPQPPQPVGAAPVRPPGVQAAVGDQASWMERRQVQHPLPVPLPAAVDRQALHAAAGSLLQDPFHLVWRDALVLLVSGGGHRHRWSTLLSEGA